MPQARSEPLYRFAWVPDMPTKLRQLAAMAESEPFNWDYPSAPSMQLYPVLYSYLHYTYRRLAEERKIKIVGNDEKACFNTGLRTKDTHQRIFAVFQPNPNRGNEGIQNWMLGSFRAEGDHDLWPFQPLPDQAQYFTNPQDAFYHPELPVSTNWRHILDTEHLDRFPVSFQNHNPFVRRILADGAIRYALERVQSSFRLAVPQYYWAEDPGPGQLQLLIPYYLEDGQKADLALALAKEGDAYRIATVLPLDWAYKLARLVAPPESFWLHP